MCLYLNPHLNDLERKKQHYKLATYFCPAENLEPPLDKNEVAIFKWGGISKKRRSRSKQDERSKFCARDSTYTCRVGLTKQTSDPKFGFYCASASSSFGKKRISHFKKFRSWWAGLWPPPRPLYPFSYISECWIMFVHQTTLRFLLLMRS